MTTHRPSSGSPARPRASARRWPARARGPTPRSSACRVASTPTSRRSGSTSPTWTRGTRSASTSPSGWRRSAASGRCSSTTRSTTGAAVRTWAKATRRTTRTRSSPTSCRPLALGDMFIRAAQPAVDAGVDVRAGADLVGVGADRVPGARDLRRGEGGDGAVGARGAGRARGPREGTLGQRRSVRASSTPRPHGARPSSRTTRIPASPASPRPSAPATCSPPTSRPRTSGTRSPTTCIAKPVLLFGEAVGVTT